MATVNPRPGADFSPQASRTSDRSDRVAFYERWLRVWVALGAVVTVVVVVFLIFISNALSGINNNLGVTTSAVTNVGGNTKTLPGQIASVNHSLASIDGALAPITGDASKIITNLTSIEGNLTTTSASLVSTSSVLSGTAGTLTGISGSLVDTSGVLSSVLGVAGQIHSTLVAANAANGNCNAPETFSDYHPPTGATAVGSYSCAASQLGVQNIHQRVSIADNVLNVAQTDLTNISGNLTQVDSSLVGACQSLVVSVLKLVGGGQC
ncbi:MAG: hypothetical protein ACRDX8_02260 [Acidimicrobiales bacterium]